MGSEAMRDMLGRAGKLCNKLGAEKNMLRQYDAAQQFLAKAELLNQHSPVCVAEGSHSCVEIEVDCSLVLSSHPSSRTRCFVRPRLLPRFLLTPSG